MLKCLLVVLLLGVCVSARTIAPKANIRVTRRLPSELNHYRHDPEDVSLMSLMVAIGTGNSQMPEIKVDITKSDLELLFCYDTTTPPQGDANPCYNPTLSKSFILVSDELGCDTVKSAFPDDVFNLPNVTFIYKNTTSLNNYLDGGEAGVVGFGWPSLQRFPDTFFPFEYLKHYNHNRFSLTVGLNGCEGKHYWGTECLEELAGAKPHYIPASSQGLWQFALQGFKFGNITQSLAAHAVITSTKGYIGMPKEFLQKMMSTYGVQWDGLYTSYVTDCNAKLPDFDVLIDGKTISIKSSQYIYRKEPLKSGKCIVNFEDSKAYGFGPQWYFGLPLLQTECVTFDYDNKQIGFTTNSETCSWCNC